MSGLTTEMNMIAFLFIFFFVAIMIISSLVFKDKLRRGLRQLHAFDRLRRAVALSVEAGKRVHFSIGSGGIQSLKGAPGLVSLSAIQKISRSASISDLPPVTSSGEANLSILSQDVLRAGYKDVNQEDKFNPDTGQLTGVTPLSYASGALPIIYDSQVSVNMLIGSFGSEVALLTDASEQAGSLTVGGSENLNAQAVLFASAQEPLVGEELFAAGAYLQISGIHLASLFTQDVFRWFLIVILFLGALLKLVGVI